MADSDSSPTSPLTYAPVAEIPSTSPHTPRSLLISFVWFTAVLIYVSTFWSKIAERLPEPLDKLAYAYRHLIGEWWRENMMSSFTVRERYIALWLLVSFVLGLLLPAIILYRSGRHWREVGCRLPNRLGLLLIALSILVAGVFGLGLVYVIQTTNQNPIGVELSWTYAMLMAAMLPEHFLICGVTTALMLPDRRFPVDVPLAESDGGVTGWLRKLGLAQPPHPGHSRVLAWFGLTRTTFFAVVMSGVLFGYVHLGKPYLPEVLLSFPGGIAVAYVTLRSQSIWPALLAHWAMNLIPIGLLRLLD